MDQQPLYARTEGGRFVPVAITRATWEPGEPLELAYEPAGGAAADPLPWAVEVSAGDAWRAVAAFAFRSAAVRHAAELLRANPWRVRLRGPRGAAGQGEAVERRLAGLRRADVG